MATPSTFAEVLEEELKLIRARRRASAGEGPVEPPRPPYDDDDRMMLARVAALGEHVTGLSFSGGGIRAGTFAIGFLQGLASLHLLKRFDYLSTVSGGGYAGSWLAAWLKREGSVENVERQLDFSRIRQSEARRKYFDPDRAQRPVVDEEPEPLRHLRAYSSYLTPRAGFLTADTWTVILIWFRNVSINLLMLLPLCMLVVLAARLSVFLYGYLDPGEIQGNPWLRVHALILLVLGIGLLHWAFSHNASALREFRLRDPARRDKRIRSRIYTRIVYPTLGAAMLLPLSARMVLWEIGGFLVLPRAPAAGGRMAGWASARDYLMSHLDLFNLPNIGLHLLFFGGLLATVAWFIGMRDGTLRAKFVGVAFLAGASGGVLFVLLEGLMRWFAQLHRPDLMATFAPPAALLILVAAMIVEVGLLGRTITEAEREWWARFSALMVIAAILWLIAMGTIIYLPYAFLASGPAVKAAITSGWLGTTAFGVLTGRYVLPRLGKGERNTLATIARVAPPVFLLGLLGAVAIPASLLVSLLVNPSGLSSLGVDPARLYAHYLKGVDGASFGALLGLAFVTLGLLTLGRRLIDVNLFSLNAMYANRLTRCYLGASRPKKRWSKRWGEDPRDPRVNTGAPSISERGNEVWPRNRDSNPVTGFDPEDDLDLVDLRIGYNPFGPALDRTYWGPHLLINTTLNLVGGEELAWRDRKGESFTLSPLYCGSKSLGYARLDEPTRQHLTLGRAVSISGAAVDPNMSFYQSAALTSFLTLFNARLGYWIRNPGLDPTHWRAEGPKYGDLLFTEFLGQTDGKGKYVHLSDGGHFENLGVYELIRRRCRYIVLIDSGEDGDPSDDNLSVLIRLCRIDFGVRIQLNTAPLRMTGDDKLAQTHVVVGRVRYDDVDYGESPGVLVYVKISLTGDEPPDLQKYARKAPDFPHQPTDLRQSFDEEQFECYRCLGDHIARDVFEDAVNRLRDQESLDHIEYVPRLFSAVQARWAESPEHEVERFLESTRAWVELQRDLRTDPNLAGLSRDLYPELPSPPAWTGAPADRDRAELHAVAQMIQIMEDAWLSLGPQGISDLPLNRGWMNTFRRWVSARAFRRYWPVLRSEFGPDFVRFCERELHLTAAPPGTLRLPAVVAPGSFEEKALTILAEEFAREWPGDASPRPAQPKRGLPELRERANALGMDEPPVWLIVESPSGTEPAECSLEKFVCGIILAADFPDHPDPSLLAREDGSTSRAVEFLVWVRRPHRSSSLGSQCTRPVLQQVRAELKARFPAENLTLWARYPKSGQGGDDDAERGMWINFFARFDFRRRYPRSNQRWSCSLLELDRV